MALPSFVPRGLTSAQLEQWANGYLENSEELLSFEPSSLVTLFELKYGQDVVRFYPAVIETPKNGQLTGLPFTKELIFNGVPYFPIPCQDENFEFSMGNQYPRPTLTISNIVNKFRSGTEDEDPEAYMSHQRFISTILRANNELKDARVSRKRILLRFLDDVNFDGGNPFGTPNPLATIEDSDWVINRVIQENRMFVAFELTAPFDAGNAKTPNRTLTARYCTFQYRGEGCRYAGIPRSDGDGKWFRYTDPATQATLEVNLRQRNVADIFEYNLLTTYQVGDSCFVSSPEMFLDEIEGVQPTYIVGNKTNPNMKPLRVCYVCIRANSAQNTHHPSTSPEYWMADACTKDIFGCAKRFVLASLKSTGETTATPYTNSYSVLPIGAATGADPMGYI